MPDMHPDGNKAVFVKTVAEEENGTFVPHIYELEFKTGVIKPVDPSVTKEKMPQYSPDGRRLAYLSDRSGEFQIYIREEGAVDGVQLTTLRHGVTYYDWSYDSSTLIFTTPLWKQEQLEHKEFTEMESEEKKDWLEEKEWAPVEITEIDYKNDDCYGIRDGSVTHIGIVTVSDGRQKLLPTGEMVCAYPSYSRDQKEIAFFGKPYAGAFASAAELFVYDLESSELKQVTKERSLMLFPSTRPLFSADGKSIYVNAYYCDDKGGSAETIYEVDIATGEAVLFFDQTDETTTFGVNSLTVGRTVYGDTKPCFSIDYENGYLYYKNAWYGRENLYRVPIGGSHSSDGSKLKARRKIEVVLENKINVHDFCLPVNGKCILLGGDLETIAELYELDMETGDLQQKTFSNEWLMVYRLARTEELWVPTTDGKSKLQIWIVHPVDEEPGKRYPVVLDIHGGPECTYVSDFWHEFQAFAEAGLVCVYTNPRGSVGYGMDFSGNEYAYKKEAIEDLLLAVDTAVERGIADPERIGVTGGSYGGYMTLKMIMETTRFKAAVAQRCLANMATSYGTGDMGFISRGSGDLSKVKMLDYLTARARRSLIRNVDTIKIPLLLLHGYKDYRCSFEQSEQMFIAMKERNPEVPVRLVMFPEENHAITRSGKLHSQIRHLKEMTDWFCKFLKEGDTINE
jgi:dipeptidyl aminopeptidase/acylaminoacyl peptidase